MYISRETIDLIRERAPIAEIIKRYVPSLQKKGRNHVGLCPFHNEKTPSFSVSPEKNIFHCFGCGETGNVFTFISKIEKLEFPESVKRVAELIGIDIPDSAGDQKPEKNRAEYEMNRRAMELYRRNLFRGSGTPGMSYLVKRGVSEKAIGDFSLGFAPDSWSFLTDAIMKNRADISLAEKLGLVSMSSKGGGPRYYDRFRNRVIFPILSPSGDVIAFGGRIIGEGSPKYLNSPESEIFHKRNVLYGFDRAKSSIRDLNRAIIVEGYLDVIGLHQAGITNVVAPLGTALTENHFQILSRYCSEIILLFDADSAGLKAAMRSIEIADNFSIITKVAVLPSGDPFDYISEKGVRPFMAVVDSSLAPADFRINRIVAESEGRPPVQVLLGIFPIIKSLKYETERSSYLKKVSTMLKLDESSVKSDFNRYMANLPIDRTKNREVKERQSGDFLSRSYRDISRLLLAYPFLIEKAAIDFSGYHIEDIAFGPLLGAIFDLYRKEENITLDKMFDFFQEGVELDFLNRLAQVEISYENPESVYQELYINLKLYDINNKIDKYAGMIKENPGKDRQEYLTELEVLRREKEKLSNYIYNK